MIKRASLTLLTALFAALLLFSTVILIGRYLSTDHLRDGIVVGITYDGGGSHEAVLSGRSGEIRHTYRREPAYVVQVRNGEKMDFWRVRNVDKYSVGEYAVR